MRQSDYTKHRALLRHESYVKQKAKWRDKQLNGKQICTIRIIRSKNYLIGTISLKRKDGCMGCL